MYLEQTNMVENLEPSFQLSFDGHRLPWWSLLMSHGFTLAAVLASENCFIPFTFGSYHAFYSVASFSFSFCSFLFSSYSLKSAACSLLKWLIKLEALNVLTVEKPQDTLFLHSRHLKEELAWTIDKRLQLIINIMLFKTVKNLKNKAVF